MTFYDGIMSLAEKGGFEKINIRDLVKAKRLTLGLSTYSESGSIPKKFDDDGLWEITEGICDKFNVASFVKLGVWYCHKQSADGTPTLHVSLTPSPRGLGYSVSGEKGECKELVEYIEALSDDVVSIVIGVGTMSKGGLGATATLLEPDDSLPTTGNYPYMEVDMDTVFEDFLNDSASVLLLIGEPGTGKTEWLKEQLLKHKVKPLLAADPAVISNAGLYEYFMRSISYDVLIVEDCDNHLTARSKGNDAMYSILATGNGLIKPPKKKMIFSTNLPSVADVDKALLRPGRCFDVLNFRKLTGEQANVIIDKNFPGADKFDVSEMVTLAEVFNRRKRGEVTKRRSIGFV